MKVDIDTAVKILQNGSVVVHPTETVYAISCGYTSEKGYEKIFQLKKRSKDKPLGILLSSFSQFPLFTDVGLEKVEHLRAFLEKGATIILPAKKDLPEHLLNQSDQIGLRIPNNKVIIDFLKRTGPLCATSANLSEKKPITCYEDCKKSFNKDVAFLDLEVEIQNTASTIFLYKDGKVFLVREGNIARHEIDKKIVISINS